MRKLILLAGFTGVLLSCGSSASDIVDQIITQNTVLPVKMVSDGETFNINYSGMKITSIVSASNAGNKAIFTYSGDNISNISNYENNVLDITEDYTYNGNVLSSLIVKDYSAPGVVQTQVKYTYTFSGNNINVQKVLTAGATTNYTVNNVYTLNNGNLVSVNGTGSGLANGTTGSITQTGSFTYSTKNYPFKNVVGFDKLVFNGDTEGSTILFSNIKNNMLTYRSEQAVQAGGSSFTSGTYFKFNVTYTDKDFPATEIRQSTDVNGNPDTSQPNTIIYTYNY